MAPVDVLRCERRIVAPPWMLVRIPTTDCSMVDRSM